MRPRSLRGLPQFILLHRARGRIGLDRRHANPKCFKERVLPQALWEKVPESVKNNPRLQLGMRGRTASAESLTCADPHAGALAPRPLLRPYSPGWQGALVSVSECLPHAAALLPASPEEAERRDGGSFGEAGPPLPSDEL